MKRNISNPKIKTLQPTWADFNGISFLFDNPVQHLEKGTSQLHKLQAGENIPFYRGIKETLDNLGQEQLLSDFLLCLLPINSYHVTYLDGLNDKNKVHLKEDLTTPFQQFQQSLPDSLSQKNRFTHFQEKPLQDIAISPIAFEYEELQNWRHKALAITLKPTISSQESYRKLVMDRRILFEQYLGEMGLTKAIPFNLKKLEGFLLPKIYTGIAEKIPDTPCEFNTLSNLKDFLASILGTQGAKHYLPWIYERLTDFTPHITLGYFANTAGGRLAAEQRENWNAQFEQKLSGTSLVFDRYSLYGFRNMAEYVKAAKDT